MTKIKDYIQKSEKDMLKVLNRFVSQRSVRDVSNPTYTFGRDIHEMLNLFIKEAECLLDGRSGRFEDYYAWVEIGDSSLPLVGIIGHVDIVDYVEANWEHKPLGELVDGTLYGRGVVDNKGPIVQSLYAMKYVQENGLPLRIRLIVGTDEETDFACMKKYVENKEEMPAYGFVPDAKFPYILSEKGIINMTIGFSKEQLGVDSKKIQVGTGTNITPDYAKVELINGKVFETKGVAAHTANDTTDPNAFVELLKLLKPYTQKGSIFARLASQIQDNYLSFTFGDEDIVVKPTLLKEKEGRFELTVDTRISICTNAETVKSYLLDHLGLDEENIVRGNIANGYAYDETHPMVQLIDSTYRETVEQLRPGLGQGEPMHIGGTTYAKYFPNCITFGPGFPGESSFGHREDERIKVQSLEEGLYIYIKLLENLAQNELEIQAI